MKMARSITLEIDVWQDIERFARLDGISLSRYVSRLIISGLNNRIEKERKRERAESEANEILEREKNGTADI